MAEGILICGANGSGKSTFGKALAQALHIAYLDSETYYFPDNTIPYSVSRSQDEVCRKLWKDIQKAKTFVLSSVKGNFNPQICSSFCAAVYMYAPIEVRLPRIRQRAFNKFGKRVCEGGDMYEQECRFYRFVASRPIKEIECAAKSLGCPLICIDGTAPITENVALVLPMLREWKRR